MTVQEFAFVDNSVKPRKMCLVRPLAAIGVRNYETRERTRKSKAQVRTLSRDLALFVVQKESAPKGR